MTSSPTIKEILLELNSAENDNIAFIFAAALNLYTENLRRVHGRVIWTPFDVKSFLSILDVMFREKGPEAQVEAKRQRKLTVEEEAALLSSMKTEEAVVQ